jgi:pimeloyl-ACP methyl ester carboxylesterase
MFQWLANRLILKPSRFPIDTGSKRRWTFLLDGHSISVWQPPPFLEPHDVERVVLKFPGMAGRAERVTSFPLDHWPDCRCVVWSVNYPGYGDSEGPADVRHLASTAEAFFRFAKETFPRASFVVSGNSLGSCLALYLSARHPVSAVLLRNPPPIHQLIRERARYNWWNFRSARFVAEAFPDSMDAVANATRSTAPALLIQSVADRVVPVAFQNRVADAYSGPLKRLEIPAGDHASAIPDHLIGQLRELLRWLVQAT